MRAYLRSTYDRKGGHEGPDASHFLYQLADDDNVVLELEGEGIITFARYNHWHGSPWRYVVDGTSIWSRKPRPPTRSTRHLIRYSSSTPITCI